MELQKFEPLLMDYALDATTPEVSALIEACQEKDAEVWAVVEQWRGIAELARRAIPAQEAVTVPIFSRQQLQTARRTMLWRGAAVWSTAVAACLALGYFAGSLRRDRSETAMTSAAARSPAVTVGADLPVAAVENFGSPAWWQALAQQNANRPVRSPNSFKNLSVLFHSSGG